MSRFGINPSKEDELDRRMQALGIREEDLEEKFIRSGGHGGQNVNKVATCVWLKHRPSGIEVKVQRERSQAINRFLARRLLVEKLETERLGRLSAEQQRIAKIRRQKRRRSRRAKEKMLRTKHHRAMIKDFRRSPGEEG